MRPATVRVSSRATSTNTDKGDTVRCGTIGCTSEATRLLTYSFPESRGLIEMEEVCEACGDMYVRRPTLKAEITTQAETREK